MKFLQILIIATLMAVMLPVEAGAQRKKVGVVLSGGGAKGVAHITALKVIEEAGIPIDYIAGTSMGAIIGGLYAIGYSTETLDSLVRTQDWTTLLSDRVPRSSLSFGAKETDEKYVVTVPLSGRKLKLPSGLVGGYNVYNLLYELTIDYHDSICFKNLPIPFSCVGFDMVTGKPVVLDSGFLPEAIRASMSIPGAFEPVRTDSMVLVDGGIGNNFPADVVRAMGAEIVIGVDVTAPMRTEDQLNSVTDLVDQLTSIIALDAYEKNLKLVDLYVHPDITSYNAASFSAAAIDSLLLRGERAMRERWDDLIDLKPEIGISVDSRPRTRQTVDPNRSLMIRQISFEGLENQSENALKGIIGIKPNSIITTEELHLAVTRLQGTSSLSQVHYRLEGHSPYDLTFIVNERSRNSLSLGFGFDTEEMATIMLNAKLALPNMSRSFIDITGKLGNNPYVRTTYTFGAETKPKFNVSYMFRHNDISVYHRGNKTSNTEFNHHQGRIFFSNVAIRNFGLDIGLSYDYYHFRSVLSLNDLAADLHSQGLVTYFVSSKVESLDSRYYPRKGISFTTDLSLVTSNFVTYKGGSPYGTVGVNFYTALSPSKRVAFIPGVFGRVLIGRRIAFPSLNFMGGAVTGRYMPQQFSFVGVHNFEAFDNALVGARFDFRVRLWVRNYVSLKLAYAKHEDDFFELFKGDDVFGVGLNYSYNSFIGPIDLLAEYSTYTKKFALYFNLGYYF